MQKINIKKYTKEQMLKMLEEAVEKQEAAEAEAAAHFKDGAKLAEENEKLRGEIGALTEKLEANAKRKEELLCAALHTIKTEKSIKEDYHLKLLWCRAYPWRNLWEWFKRKLKMA